jgi:hypothetical protein
VKKRESLPGAHALCARCAQAVAEFVALSSSDEQ